MRLNRATDIGLRAVMFSASRGGQVTIDDLAAALDVPRHHLAKVVQRMQRLGFLETVRGRGGGVRLTVGTRAMSVGHLVRALEGEAEVVECDEPACPLRYGCRLRSALRQAQEAFYASLDGVPVTDLLLSPTAEVLFSLASALPAREAASPAGRQACPP